MMWPVTDLTLGAPPSQSVASLAQKNTISKTVNFCAGDNRTLAKVINGIVSLYHDFHYHLFLKMFIWMVG